MLWPSLVYMLDVCTVKLSHFARLLHGRAFYGNEHCIIQMIVSEPSTFHNHYSIYCKECSTTAVDTGNKTGKNIA